MAVTNQIKPIALTTKASSGVSGTYAAINTSGLPFGCAIITIVNNSSQDVTVSYDGTNDHDYIPTMSTRQQYLQTNAQPNTNIARLAAGTKVYIKGTAGTGNIYLSGWYQPQAN